MNQKARPCEELEGLSVGGVLQEWRDLQELTKSTKLRVSLPSGGDESSGDIFDVALRLCGRGQGVNTSRMCCIRNTVVEEEP